MISISKHSITGVSPKLAGNYYYTVDMIYVSTEGETLNWFETTLELVVKGVESNTNHLLHIKNGYEHGLADHLNSNEKLDLFKFLTILLIVIVSFFGLAICLWL